MARPPQRDLTTGPIGRTLLLFALPTLGSSILQSLNGSINAIWIGQFLGERALAATTNANIIMFLLIAAVFGFGMAATILIGQAMGRRDVETVRRTLGTALGLSVACRSSRSSSACSPRPPSCGCWRPRRRSIRWRSITCGSSSSRWCRAS